jgi:hypothetical protein
VKIPEGEWDMTCPAKLFATLRSDKEFTFLVALARSVNALKFGIAAIEAVGDQVSPGAERQRFQGFLYLTGALHELLEFKKESEERWSGLTAYQDAFNALNNEGLDAKTTKLISKVRNRVAFHMKIDVVERTLPQMPLETLCFLAAEGKRRMESNYELANIITFGFAFGPLNDIEKAYVDFHEYYGLMLLLIQKFTYLADNVIVRRLRARGVRLQQREKGTYWMSRQEGQIAAG